MAPMRARRLPVRQGEGGGKDVRFHAPCLTRRFFRAGKVSGRPQERRSGRGLPAERTWPRNVHGGEKRASRGRVIPRQVCEIGSTTRKPRSKTLVVEK